MHHTDNVHNNPKPVTCNMQLATKINQAYQVSTNLYDNYA